MKITHIEIFKKTPKQKADERSSEGDERSSEMRRLGVPKLSKTRAKVKNSHLERSSEMGRPGAPRSHL